MATNSERPTTRILFIDGNANDRAIYAGGLRRCSSDYQIIEAADGQSGLDLYRRSQRIDCVVLELALQNRSGLTLLADFIPIPRKREVAVIVLTQHRYQGLLEIAKQKGAYACFLKDDTSSEDLDRAIRQAVAVVGRVPKVDRYRVPIVNHETSRTAE